MPVPLDKCASCQLPVFAEDAVPGGCGCPERELRVLLAQRRKANEGVGLRPPNMNRDCLPALTPEMLMSSEGRSEFRAAQGIRGRTVDAVMLDEAMNFEAPARHNHRQASAPQVNLEELWMVNSGIPYEPGETSTGPEDFEFTSDEADIDVGTPRPSGGRQVGGQRFQVGRDPVPRTPPMSREVVPGPQGGPMREIGRAGRFAVLGEIPPPREPLMVEVPTVLSRIQTQLNRDRPERPARQEQPERQARPRNAMEQSRVMQAKERLPTVYDRIQNGFLDDD